MKIAIEKEMLIFDRNWSPVSFNLSELPNNISLDFSDNQLEIVSVPHSDAQSLLDELTDCLNFIIKHNVNIWPLSPSLTEQSNVSFVGHENQDMINYRQHLLNTYDQNLLLTSGIHLNISFNDQCDHFYSTQEHYFELMKTLYTYGPIILQFTAHSPLLAHNINGQLDKFAKNYGLANSISLRNSSTFGYSNERFLNLDFTSLATYQASIELAIANKIIASKKELYTKIRLKEASGQNYLELRFIDLNPYYMHGIDYSTLELLIVFCNFAKLHPIEDFNHLQALQNFDTVAESGQDQNQKLVVNNVEDTLINHTNRLLDALIAFADSETIDSVKDLKAAYNQQTLDLNKQLVEIKNFDLSVNEFGKKHSFN